MWIFLDLSSAVFLHIFLAVCFVGSLRVWWNWEHVDRSDVRVINRRILSTVATCIVSCICFYHCLLKDHPFLEDPFRSVGDTISQFDTHYSKSIHSPIYIEISQITSILRTLPVNEPIGNHMHALGDSVFGPSISALLGLQASFFTLLLIIPFALAITILPYITLLFQNFLAYVVEKECEDAPRDIFTGIRKALSLTKAIYTLRSTVDSYFPLKEVSTGLSLTVESFTQQTQTSYYELPFFCSLRDQVVAPLSEEFVFRGVGLSFLFAAGVAPVSIIWVGALIFGASHFHHAYSLSSSIGWRKAIMRSLFQFLYTSLFGAYAALLQYKLHSLPAAICAHTLCNFMGLPFADVPQSLAKYKHLTRMQFFMKIVALVGFFLAIAILSFM